MKLRCARRRVAEAEAALIAQRQQLGEHWNALGAHTKAALTPTRLIAGGLLSGVVIGALGPHRAVARLVTGARLTQFASSLWALIGALQAKFAAEQAEAVAEQAQDAAVAAAGAVSDATIATAAAGEPDAVAAVLADAADARIEAAHPHAQRAQGTVAATVEALGGAAPQPATLDTDGAVHARGALSAALEEPTDPALRVAPPTPLERARR